mmetsp:Transcript_25660/g.52550  ORF Transcript_25660/g.52550 Transcript_25660/m.52550 type:complete len:87 (+) Transcript_25660:865-1125(+)
MNYAVEKKKLLFLSIENTAIESQGLGLPKQRVKAKAISRFHTSAFLQAVLNAHNRDCRKPKISKRIIQIFCQMGQVGESTGHIGKA